MTTVLPAIPSPTGTAVFVKGFANGGVNVTAAQYISFGHCFQRGQMSQAGMSASFGNNTTVPCQVDVKTRYADGSAAHAIITLQVPPVTQGQTMWGQFSPSPAPPGSTLAIGTALGSTTLTATLSGTALPDWAASTVYKQNAVIKPTVGNAGGYVFQYPSSVNGTSGTSGTTEPVWPQTEGASVKDGTLLDQSWMSGVQGWLNVGPPFPASLTQDLVAAVKSSTDLWLSGPLAVQARVYILSSNPSNLPSVVVNSSLPALMRMVVDFTAYADGTVLADFRIANDTFQSLLTAPGANSICGGTQTYTATLTLNGAVSYNSGPLVHNALEDWTWQVGTVPRVTNSSQDLVLQVIHSPTDFVEAQAVVPYDTTVGVGSDGNGNAYASDADAIISATNFGQPFSNPDSVVLTNMPNYGVSYPNAGIGPNCFWQMWWLTTQNPSFYGAGLEAAKVNGGIPWHVWNPNTGSYWNAGDDAHITVPFTQGPTDTGGGAKHPPPIATADAVWQLDFEHYPDLTYIAYLLTGRRYFLDQLVATSLYSQQSNQNATNGYQTPMWGPTIFFVNCLTCRTQGWGFRNTLYALYACPDGSRDKAWFKTVVDANLSWLCSNLKYYQGFQGESFGWLPSNYGSHLMVAPWQDDYTLYVICLAAVMGHPLAFQIAQWMLNFRVGVLTNSAGWPPDGYPTADAVIYDIPMWNPNSPSAFIYNSWKPASSWTGVEQLVRLLSKPQYVSSIASNTANAVFSGTLTASGSLTVSGIIAGALAPGMTLYPNSSAYPGTNPMATILSGSGTTWTTDYASSPYTGTMSASDYNLPGEFAYWWTGTGGGGGNVDDYDQLLYNSLIQGEILGYPSAATARATLLGLVDAAGVPVPNVASETSWQNALVTRLALRTANNSQVLEPSSMSPTARSLVVLSALRPDAPAETHMSSTNVTITVTSTPSTAVTFTAAASGFVAPVAPGTILGSVAVTPSTWSGTLSLTGTNASSVAVSGTNIVVGATALSAGSYTFTIDATP